MEIPLRRPEQPTLLDAEIRLKRGEQVLDQCKSYTALRSVEIVRECFPPRRTGAKVRNRFRTSRLGDLARANPRPKSDGPERKLSDLVMALGVIEWGKYGKKFCSYRVHPPLKKGGLGDFPMLPYNRRLNLEQQGLKVLRFDDRQVLLQTEAMLETIFQAMKNPS